MEKNNKLNLSIIFEESEDDESCVKCSDEEESITE